MIICFGVFGLAENSQGATIYADNTLSGNCAGNYSIANRNCSGSSGNAYATIPAALAAMSVGDIIYMRGGTYTFGGGSGHYCVSIPYNKNGTAWTTGNFNTLASYPGEWAVLDGQNNCGDRGIVLGIYEAEYGNSGDIAYWKFERFEIKGGRTTDGQFGYGLFVMGGPVWLRYMYIHDNIATTGINNPMGFGSYHLHDSIVEYGYFYNNGTTGYSDNSAHIGIFTDYCGGSWCYWLINGYSGGTSSYVSAKSNIIRYNYLNTTGGTGIKYKSYQALSGRNTAGGHPPSYTYANHGDKIHHNIIKNSIWTGILDHQDFTQIYNNIIETASIGVSTGYEREYWNTFANVIYNNTFVDIDEILTGGSTSYYGAILHWGDDSADGSIPVADRKLWFWDLNNITDSCAGGSGQINLGQVQWNSSKGIYIGSHNYFYRPDNNTIYDFLDTTYTQSMYQVQTATDSPRVAYQNAYNAGDPLWTGTSGASKYIARGEHILTGSTTLANGGVGGAHPYLTGKILPTYVGATDPTDNAWVDGVLNLASVSNMQNAGNGDPNWIEGGGGSDLTPPAAPQGLQVN